MRIIKSFPDLQSAIPKAARVLKDLNEVLTYEGYYGARHPTASYNVSPSAVIRRLATLLKVHKCSPCWEGPQNRRGETRRRHSMLNP